MKCEHAQEWLSRDMDGELDARAKAELDQHVAGCAGCQAAVAAWRQAGELLRTEAVAAPPAEVMAADVLRAIRLAQPEGEPGWMAGRMKWAGMAVGLFLLGAALWGMLGTRMAMVEVAANVAAPMVESAEAELPGASVMVYEDAESDTVVIWLMVADNGEKAPKGT